MQAEIPGIHHVTAIAGEPQTNIDFYAGVLGLRLVKLTVNFDDPSTYHLYYGDGQGHPGTILTFFPWPGAMQGRIGTGQVATTSFAVPERALDYWKKRFAEHDVECKESRSLLEEPALTFSDPDGLQLELVSSADANPERAWEQGPVPLEYGIRGFHHVTLSEEGYERTAALLTGSLGFQLVHSSGSQFRYSTSSGGPGSIVDVLCMPAGRVGRGGVGTVHHVAWRAKTDGQQMDWRSMLSEDGYNVTPVIDRKYFHSIYFREPGGVLLEIATDAPGFAVDEPAAELGTHLVLPEWLEPSRPKLQAILPKVELPVWNRRT
jgi:Lactoylglutathione lyase and related lyases